VLGGHWSHRRDERHKRLKPSSELQQENSSDSSVCTGRDRGNPGDQFVALSFEDFKTGIFKEIVQDVYWVM